MSDDAWEEIACAAKLMESASVSDKNRVILIPEGDDYIEVMTDENGDVITNH